ncbi:MAG: AAA family ATPase [Candidatus Bathyarchaeia archaeon]
MRSSVVIGVAGMPGAGKATVVEVAKKKDYGVVVMGDEVREETKRRNLELTPENVGKVMLLMRQEEGPAAVAKRCVPKIEQLRKPVVIVDGIRSIYEADAFKKHFPKFKLLAIHTSPETRFKRLFRRKRSDDPERWETFLERDWRELHVGLGSVIASADVIIVNEGKREQLKSEVQSFLENVKRSGRSTRASGSRG